MKLPTRVEIRHDDAYIRFTIEVEYEVAPVANEPISFQYQDWPEPVLAFTQYRYHHVGEKAASVVCCVITARDSDELLRIFDRFKDSTIIGSPDTGGAAPPGHYRPYRVCQALWGSLWFEPKTDSPAALAELVRAMWMSAGDDGRSQVVAESVHKTIVDIKTRRLRHQREEPIELADLFKRLGDDFCAHLARADSDKTVSIARFLFSSLKSVTVDQQPDCVKDVPAAESEVGGITKEVLADGLEQAKKVGAEGGPVDACDLKKG